MYINKLFGGIDPFNFMKYVFIEAMTLLRLFILFNLRLTQIPYMNGLQMYFYT